MNLNNPFKHISTISDVHADAADQAKQTISHHIFGKARNHVGPFMAVALQNFTLAAPALAIVALIVSILAVRQASAFITAYTRELKSAAVSNLAPLIEKKPLGPADYQSAANIIAKNNPAMQVALSKTRDSILISMKDPALLPEFMYALSTIQSFRHGVAWNANTLCLNKCEGGGAASAEITAYTQAISFTGLNLK